MGWLNEADAKKMRTSCIAAMAMIGAAASVEGAAEALECLANAEALLADAQHMLGSFTRSGPNPKSRRKG